MEHLLPSKLLIKDLPSGSDMDLGSKQDIGEANHESSMDQIRSPIHVELRF